KVLVERDGAAVKPKCLKLSTVQNAYTTRNQDAIHPSTDAEEEEEGKASKSR
ncbi:hypothetical protein V7S43_005901, partial [Phytophthora oleae]